MAELCVKGAAVALARDQIRSALAEGRLAPAHLEARLREGDRALLDDAPAGEAWVPVARYERLLRLLLEVEGQGDPAYLVAWGRERAEALLAVATPRQLTDALESPAPRAPDDWFARGGLALVTLPSVLFSEGRWKLSQAADGGRLFTLAGEGLGRLPMNVARIVEGALQRLASRLAEREVHVRTEQPAEGQVVFVATI